MHHLTCFHLLKTEGVNQSGWQRAHPKIHQKIPGNYENLYFNIT